MEEQLKIANDYLKNNNYDMAIVKYTECLESTLDKYKIYMNRCICYFKLEQYDDALVDAYRSVQLNKNSAKALGRVGSCLLALERKEESIDAFKQAYELEPTNINYKKLSYQEDKTDSENDDMPPLIEQLMGNNFNSICSSILNNDKLIKKILDKNFQNKILSDTFELLNDNELNIIMKNVISKYN
jgi:tetratricopeptide (TPR) repeat protein